MPDRTVGRRLFTDGATPDVFEDPDGRQYIVHEDTGERIYGQWLWPPDEPVLVDDPAMKPKELSLPPPEAAAYNRRRLAEPTSEAP